MRGNESRFLPIRDGTAGYLVPVYMSDDRCLRNVGLISVWMAVEIPAQIWNKISLNIY